MHNHGTRNARYNLVDIPQVRTQTYGHFSTKSHCTNIWNILQNSLEKDLMEISQPCKEVCDGVSFKQLHLKYIFVNIYIKYV